MNWYEVLGVMDDGARIYSKKVIVAADSSYEAVEKTKKALCRCADEVFHATKCSPLNQNKSVCTVYWKSYSGSGSSCERMTTMTKDDLEFIRDNHELNKKSYDDHATCGYNYEDGYVDALNFVLEHLDELCEETHKDKLMRRATEKAKYYIREYFQRKYDCEWLADEIEDCIQQVLDEGDAETIANSFIDSADDGIPNDDWCETIVRNFYD